MSACRSCAAAIVWAVTDNGKRIPLDAHPTPAGSVRLHDTVPPRAVVVGATIDLFDPTDDGTRYMPHHATCPQADEWRRP
ncbi:MAG: hypothetical protein WKF64_08465 [Ilumatobacteraceae bacterium]